MGPVNLNAFVRFVLAGSCALALAGVGHTASAARRAVEATGRHPIGQASTPDAGHQQPPQGRGEQQPQVPTFRTAANYVRVDAYPTADGRPITDLRAEDFEVLEDGVPQKIESFEHVEVRGQVPTTEKREPNTVAEGEAAAADPRSRVFVIFLDTYHT
jgi:hypothetical protein